MENYLPGVNNNRRQVHNELTVLDDRTRFALPPPELTFRGYEHENFRMFRREFTSYVLITGAQTESRRLEILQGVLQGPALTYYVTEILPYLQELRDEENTPPTVTAAMDLLERNYVTEYDLQRYRERFNNIAQRYNESPRSYLGRLRQAAHEADIKDEEHIESRFKTGLLPEIRKHCMRMCVMSHKDVLRNAEGYWNAELEDKASRNPIIRRKKYTPLNTMENMGNQDYPDDDRHVEQTFEDLLQQGLSFADAIRTMGYQTRSTYHTNFINNQKPQKLEYPSNCTKQLRRTIRSQNKYYQVQNNKLYRQGRTQRLVLTKTAAHEAIFAHHSHALGGHYAFDNTYYKIKQKYYVPGLTKMIRDYINQCDRCQRQASKNNLEPLNPIPVAAKIFHHVQIDAKFVRRSRGGYRYILSCFDLFSKYVENGGGENINAIVKSICKQYNIEHRKGSPYNSRSQGGIERWHRNLNMMIKRLPNEEKQDWDLYLDALLFGFG
ncbi:hypothetical protein INT45_002193 [Circinella minor]|uniref:Integrase catalytic domain-containing protein n=1 Tax=Circinella minor TaxID=1195481 RepID=A0A8H7RPA7_9FUNG|nr:hypothetical protein INT45_002193 [Circinella minor]